MPNAGDDARNREDVGCELLHEWSPEEEQNEYERKCGRRPLIALEEAESIGRKRGRVVLLPGKRGDYFNLLLYQILVTIHVRGKQSITGLCDPWEILATYRSEIIHLSKIPLTAIVAREFWIHSPRGTWRFFRIPADKIVEIREDGSVIYGADFSFSVLEALVRSARPADSAGPVSVKNSSDSIGWSIPANGSVKLVVYP